MADDPTYANIRDARLLGSIIGERLLDVTQHDKSEFEEDGVCRIYLHFGNGVTFVVPIGDDGFEIQGLPGDAE